MTYLITSAAASGNIYSGKTYVMEPGGASPTEESLPSGVQGMNVRPIAVMYRKRIYIWGQFSQGLLRTEFGTAHAVGIEPFTSTATIAASGTGITASVIGKLTAVHKHQVGNDWVVVHESSGGEATNTLALSNQGLSWTSLPTTHPNPRVTHIRGYRSVDGATYRLAWERELGTTSVTENVATAALGQVINDNRDRPPYAKFAEIYHDRMWLAGNPDFPYRLYYSEQTEPESVGTNNYIDLRDGEAITGLKRCGDQLVIFGRRATYTVQGFDETDLRMRKVSPSIGCVSPYAIVNIGERLWFPSEDGIHVFNGASFTYMMDDLRDYYRDDYLSNQAAYEDMIACDDRYTHVYKALVVKDVSGVTGSSNSFYYVVNYQDVEPELGGSGNNPRISFDIRARQDSALGLLADVNSRRDQLYTGSCDGYVRKENVAANADDDSDSYAKAITIWSKLYWMDGGDVEEGRRVRRFWSYLQSEQVSWRIQAYGGDESAIDQLTENYNETPAASAASEAISGSTYTFVPKSVHVHRPEKLSGRGFSFRWSASSPLGFKWRGHGGEVDQGAASRGYSSVV